MDTAKCKSCNAEIVWIKTNVSKPILVNADTYNGDEIYNSKLHTSHFATCPDANKWRRR